MNKIDLNGRGGHRYRRRQGHRATRSRTGFLLPRCKGQHLGYRRARAWRRRWKPLPVALTSGAIRLMSPMPTPSSAGGTRAIAAFGKIDILVNNARCRRHHRQCLGAAPRELATHADPQPHCHISVLPGHRPAHDRQRLWADRQYRLERRQDGGARQLPPMRRRRPE